MIKLQIKENNCNEDISTPTFCIASILLPVIHMRVPRDLQRQLVPTLKDVLPIVLSDENAPKTRIFCKIRTFHIYFCSLFKLFTLFGTQGKALKNKLNN